MVYSWRDICCMKVSVQWSCLRAPEYMGIVSFSMWTRCGWGYNLA